MTLPAMTLCSAGSVRGPVGAHDDPAAGQALADVVVGVAVQPQGDAGGQERAEATGRRSRSACTSMVSSARPCGCSLGDLVAEHRADGAVDVADRRARCAPASPSSRASWRIGDELVVEGLLEPVVLGDRVVRGPRRRGCSTSVRIGVRSRPAAFQCSTAAVGVEAVDAGRSPPRWCGSRARRGARGPPRRCTRRRSRRTPACRRTARAARGSGWRCRPGRCRGGRRAS